MYFFYEDAKNMLFENQSKVFAICAKSDNLRNSRQNSKWSKAKMCITAHNKTEKLHKIQTVGMNCKTKHT